MTKLKRSVFFLNDDLFIFSSWAEEGERSDTNFSDIGEADSVGYHFDLINRCSDFFIFSGL